MKIQVVNDTNQFAELREQWNELLISSSLDNVFLTHEWLHTWWEIFGAESKLFILLCRDEDHGLVGIFPGYLKNSGMPVKTRAIRLLGSEYVTSDFLECFAVAGQEESVYSAVFEYLSSNSSLWDVLEITDVPRESYFAAYLNKQSPVQAFTMQDNDKVCPYIPLPTSWDDFLAGLSAKTRRNVRYYRNNLGRHAQVELEVVSSHEQLQAVTPDMIRLHQERKEQVGFSGRFSSERYTRFHQKICDNFLTAGWLLLIFLKVDGKRVAFYYCFSYKKRVNVYQSGFDIEWSKFSVGALLMGYLVEMSIADGNRYIDFLRGREAYKYHWTEQERKLLDFTAYNESIRGNIAEVARQTYSGAKSGLKKILPDSLFDKAKKIRNSFSSDR